ncbi:PEPxxWA-CTERM sorting domain-containing protein [Thermaurantiacus tibetensis]|uniref:PEPxxWA-CTERM sorting domain-containing protein n=1 Tax=Thermaurantiacus tibetensis TaxID=2759035 RepID=UPI001F1C35F5|nr:PEPxxWA-CTERM sorting domain-containing protein [Thermaurantiacus tibetensis]
MSHGKRALLGAVLVMASPEAAWGNRVLEGSQVLSLSHRYAGVADNSAFDSSEDRFAFVDLSDFFATLLPFAPFDFLTGELLEATLAVSLDYRDLVSVGVSGGIGLAGISERFLSFAAYQGDDLLALRDGFYRSPLICRTEGPVCLQLSEARGRWDFAFDVTRSYGRTDFDGLTVALATDAEAQFVWATPPRPNFVATRNTAWDATFTLSWRYYEVAPGSPLPAVPEPATWALMLAGFGLTGGTLRRARRVPA